MVSVNHGLDVGHVRDVGSWYIFSCNSAAIASPIWQPALIPTFFSNLNFNMATAPVDSFLDVFKLKHLLNFIKQDLYHVIFTNIAKKCSFLTAGFVYKN